MSEINPNEVYTTKEAQSLLKISDSTMKRIIKRGLINAHKLGGHYRILGKEILKAVSPSIERKAVARYQSFKKKIKKEVKNW